MINIQSYYVSYIKEYVKLLTGNKEEFFLSICDIEEELLQELDISILSDYAVVLVDNKDYSQAVQLRNNINIKKIVLLSSEGVKQIDSLKDFNEYSILSRDRTLIWQCLEHVFHVRLDKNAKTFFETILSQREISFCDFLQYLYEAGIQTCQIIPKQLNENLPKLGIWKSRANRILTKAKIRKMIQFSRYGVIENRLTNAMVNNLIHDPKDAKLITTSLAHENIQRILNNIYFEDAESYLKYSPRDSSRNSFINNGVEDNSLSETSNYFSYEFILSEHIDIDIKIMEKQFLNEKGKENASIDLNWDKYRPLADHASEYGSQFDALSAQIANLNLSSQKIDVLQKQLVSLQLSFYDAWDEVTRTTPLCLYSFCESSKKYTEKYFELLALLLTDEKIRYSIIQTSIINKIHTLFCHVEIKEIKMPFYHPICVFYYMGIQKFYEYTLHNYKDDIPLKINVLEALIHKLGMQFPVNFIEFNEQHYALDYTSIWKNQAVLFQNMEEGAVYSVLDFRIIQKQVIEYIEAHPFLTEITIALIDISDLSGLLQLIDRIQQISQGNYCNIGHITFFILSPKEEELKNTLSQMWDTIGTNNIIRFRFGKNSYLYKDQKRGLQYDIKKIVSESDLIIIADGSVLYHTPRMVKVQVDSNMIYNRITQISLKQQIDNYFTSGKSDIPVLWDTLQHAATDWEDGLWIRKSKEINNEILIFINQIVSRDPNKRIVTLSSNENILLDIYKIDFMHAYRQKYNGKNITIIQFDQANQVRRIPAIGKCEITYSLNDFYNMTLELEDFSKKITPDIKDVFIQIYYKNEQYFYQCKIYRDDTDDASYFQQSYADFLNWQMNCFLEESNILSQYLRDLLINQWYEKTESIPAVLMIEKLYEGHTMNPLYNTFNAEEIPQNKSVSVESDCMESIKIQDMFLFTKEKEVIDEYTVNQFQEQFEIGLLNQVINCDNEQHLLNIQTKEKLLEIQKRIKEK